MHAKEDDAGYDDRNKAQDYAAIGAAADMVCVMAYDWHWSTSTPGPIAPYDWVQRVIQYTLTQVPAGKVILGVGLFGYDWVGSQGQSLTCDQVTAPAEKNSAPDPPSVLIMGSWSLSGLHSDHEPMINSRKGGVSGPGRPDELRCSN